MSFIIHIIHPVAMMAMNEINNSPSILPGHRYFVHTEDFIYEVYSVGKFCV